jgi:hypothetical protein
MRIQLAVVMALVVGCGGGSSGSSGVDPALELGTLEADDTEVLCVYGEEIFTSRTVTCGENTFTVSATAEDCIDLIEALPEGCAATVAEMEACLESVAAQTDEEFCNDGSPSACAFFGDPDCRIPA